MSVQIIDTLEPKNNGSFPIARAKDIEMPDGTRLSDWKFEEDDNVETDIFPLQQVGGFSMDESYGGYTVFVDSEQFALEIGGKYTVVWDGSSYNCIAQDMSSVITGAIGLGNLAAYGGIGAEEPFAVAWIEGLIGFLASDDLPSHEIRVYQTVSTPKLPAVTIGDNGKFLRVVGGAWAAVAMLDVSEVGL